MNTIKNNAYLMPGDKLICHNGNQFIIKRVASIGGNSVLYTAACNTTKLNYIIKELKPNISEGNVSIIRYDGILLPENEYDEKQVAFKKEELHKRYLREAENSQIISNRTDLVIPITELLHIKNIVYARSEDQRELENCHMMLMRQYGSDGLFLNDILAECAKTTSPNYSLRTGGLPSIETTVRIMLGISKALSAVHKSGYIHGDIHVGNIYFSAIDLINNNLGQCKLIDFGSVASLNGSGETDPYPEDEIFTAKEYAAPENWIRKLDGIVRGPETDVFALTKLFVFLLTGSFENSISLGQLHNVGCFNKSAKNAVRNIVAAGLIEDRNERKAHYANAEEFYSDIYNLAMIINVPSHEEFSSNKTFKYYQAFMARIKNERNKHPSLKSTKIDSNLYSSISEVSTGKKSNKEKNYCKDDSSLSNCLYNYWHSKNHNVFLEGIGGIGKTVSLLQIELISPFTKAPIPVAYMQLNRLNNCKPSDVEDSIEWLLNNYCKFDYSLINEVKRLACMEENKPSFCPNIVFLLDGYDEICDERRNSLDNSIDDWAMLPGIQIIITGRTAPSRYCDFNVIKLNTLPAFTVEKYLKKKGIIGTQGTCASNNLTQILNTPLMLKLFSETESLRSVNNFVSLRDVSCEGDLIWNYLLCQLERCKNSQFPLIDCAYVMGVTLPHLCWIMNCERTFSFSENILDEIIDSIITADSKTDLSPGLVSRINGIDISHLDSSREKINGETQKNIIKNLSGIFELVDDQFVLVHQNYRDSLAVIHLANQLTAFEKRQNKDKANNKKVNDLLLAILETYGEEASDDVQNVLSKHTISCNDSCDDLTAVSDWYLRPFDASIINYFADYLKDEGVQKFWDAARKTQRMLSDSLSKKNADEYEYIKVSYLTANMINVHENQAEKKHRATNDFSQCSFQGMDLRRINLLFTPKLSNEAITFPKEKEAFQNSIFSSKTFFLDNGGLSPYRHFALSNDNARFVVADTNTIYIWDLYTYGLRAIHIDDKGSIYHMAFVNNKKLCVVVKKVMDDDYSLWIVDIYFGTAHKIQHRFPFWNTNICLDQNVIYFYKEDTKETAAVDIQSYNVFYPESILVKSFFKTSGDTRGAYVEDIQISNSLIIWNTISNHKSLCTITVFDKKTEKRIISLLVNSKNEMPLYEWFGYYLDDNKANIVVRNSINEVTVISLVCQGQSFEQKKDTFYLDSDNICLFEFVNQGKKCIVWHDNSNCTVIDLTTQQLFSICLHEAANLSLDTCATDSFAAFASNNSIMIYDFAQKSIVRSFYTNNEEIDYIGCMPEGSALFVATKSMVYIWDADSGRRVATLNEKIAPPTILVSSPYSRKCLVAVAHVVHVVSVDDRRITAVIRADNMLSNVCFGKNDQEIILISETTTVSFWQCVDGYWECRNERKIPIYNCIDNKIKGLAYSEYDNSVVICFENRLVLWDLKDTFTTVFEAQGDDLPLKLLSKNTNRFVFFSVKSDLYVLDLELNEISRIENNSFHCLDGIPVSDNKLLLYGVLTNHDSHTVATYCEAIFDDSKNMIINDWGESGWQMYANNFFDSMLNKTPVKMCIAMSDNYILAGESLELYHMDNGSPVYNCSFGSQITPTLFDHGYSADEFYVVDDDCNFIVIDGQNSSLDILGTVFPNVDIINSDFTEITTDASFSEETIRNLRFNGAEI